MYIQNDSNFTLFLYTKTIKKYIGRRVLVTCCRIVDKKSNKLVEKASVSTFYICKIRVPRP